MTKATIKEVRVDSVLVEFADKSVATVPTFKGQTLDELIAVIYQFWSPLTKWDKVDDLPVKAGDEVTKPVTPDRDVDYQEARSKLYPSLGDQFDAAYWARKGDDTQQKAIDAKIELVKSKIAKGTTYKESKVDKSLLD